MIIVYNHQSADSSDTSSKEEIAEKRKEYENKLNAFDGDWSTLQAAITTTHKLEPVLIQCKLDQEEAFAQATKKMEGWLANTVEFPSFFSKLKRGLFILPRYHKNTFRAKTSVHELYQY